MRSSIPSALTSPAALTEWPDSSPVMPVSTKPALPSPPPPGNKRTILQAEGLDPDGLESAARSGIRFVGSDTTHVVCLPTCHAAKRITPPHRISFRSFERATAAGYRACRECRPESGVLAA